MAGRSRASFRPVPSPRTIAPGGIGSIGTLTIGSLLTSSNLTLNFDLTTPGGSGDLLTITNGLTVGQGTPITFGTNPPAVPGEYQLIGGNFGTPNLSYFHLPAAGRRNILADDRGRLHRPRGGARAFDLHPPWRRGDRAAGLGVAAEAIDVRARLRA